ncbi:LapA family protein [Thermoleophilia bacterium SCSIO 60948]|nr:LapA family protein [Thermoleophilia bacterium SCSIO 60948]
MSNQGGSRGAQFWVGIAALVLLVVFVIQNFQEVTVDFLFTTTQTPLVIALVIAGVLGALIGWLVPRVRRRD